MTGKLAIPHQEIIQHHATMRGMGFRDAPVRVTGRVALRQPYQEVAAFANSDGPVFGFGYWTHGLPTSRLEQVRIDQADEVRVEETAVEDPHILMQQDQMGWRILEITEDGLCMAIRELSPVPARAQFDRLVAAVGALADSAKHV